MRVTRGQLLDERVYQAVLNTISKCDKSNKCLPLQCGGFRCRECPLEYVSPSCRDSQSTRTADGWRLYLNEVVFQIPKDSSLEEDISFLIQIMLDETKRSNEATMFKMAKLLEIIYNHHCKEAE